MPETTPRQKIDKVQSFGDGYIKIVLIGKTYDESSVAAFAKAHGGYIVVKENGEVVCYHLYNCDEFRSYLYENTKLDAPSSARYEYGKLYEENGKLFFGLNLQIRFLK